MIYHRHSLVALQLYLLFGLFAFQPLRNLKEITANHLESPGRKAYSRVEAQRMFWKFRDLSIETVLTPYDLRYRGINTSHYGSARLSQTASVG